MTEPGEDAFPVVQDLIRLLRDAETPADVAFNAERVFESLRRHLSSVLGTSGYATLLARSLALTRNEHPGLAGLTTDKNGSLQGQFTELSEGRDPADAARGFAALLRRFAMLLTTFIGEDLTNRLLEAVWQNLENNTDKNRGDKAL